VVAAAFFVVGFSVGLSNVASASVRQVTVPRRVYGRVTAAFRWVAVGLGPIGGRCAGFVADAFGLHAPFLLCGAVLVVALLIVVPAVSNQKVQQAEAAADADSAHEPAPSAASGGR
jgi:MFS family permease